MYYSWKVFFTLEMFRFFYSALVSAAVEIKWLPLMCLSSVSHKSTLPFVRTVLC